MALPFLFTSFGNHQIQNQHATVAESDRRSKRPKSFREGSISAIDVLFSDHPICLDLIFIYLPDPMISTGNPRLLKPFSISFLLLSLLKSE